MPRSPGNPDNPNNPDYYRLNLAELRSADADRRTFAVLRLADAPPVQLREEIAKAVEDVVRDPKSNVRIPALRGVVAWSTGDVVPLAIDLLKDADPNLRYAAIELIDKHKDPRAIEPLLALLSMWATVKQSNA